VASGSLLLSELCPGGKTVLSHPEKSLMLQHYLMFHHGQLQARGKPVVWQIWAVFFIIFFMAEDTVHENALAHSRVRRACKESPHLLSGCLSIFER
jgi:hypothetical protein